MKMRDSVYSSNLIKMDAAAVLPGLFVHAMGVDSDGSEFATGGLLVKNADESNRIKGTAKWIVVSKKDSNKEALKLAMDFKSKPIKTDDVTTAKKSSAYRSPVVATGNKGKYGFFSLPSIFSIFRFNSLKDNFNPNEVEMPSPERNGIIRAYYDRIVRAKLLRSLFKSDKLTSSSLATQVTITSLSEENESAKVVAEQLHSVTPKSLSLDFSRSELHGEFDTASDVISQLVDTVCRNPSSVQLVSKIIHQDRMSYQHSIDVSIMMVAFGREMCFPKHELLQIGLGGLLHDIGEIELSEHSNTEIRNIANYKIYKEHIERGLKIAESLGCGSIVKQMIANHHEHFDGSGYPNKLKGIEIGFFASMLTIVDVYISLTTGRCSHKQLVPSKAIKLMYKKRGEMFHPEMLDQFIRMIGIYPVGTTVKLASGETGLVIKQNKVRKLKPVVMVIKDKDGRALKDPIYIDLLKNENEGGDLFIAKEISATSAGVTPEDYLIKGKS